MIGKTVRQRGGEEEGDFWKSLQTHFLVYPAFEKSREPPLFLHPHRSYTIVSQLLAHQACQLLPEAPIGLSLITLALCSFTFTDSFHSFSKPFPSFLYPFSQFLPFCTALRSIVASRGPLVNNFSTRSSWGLPLFILGLWPLAQALVCFKWETWLRLKLMVGNL